MARQTQNDGGKKASGLTRRELLQQLAYLQRALAQNQQSILSLSQQETTGDERSDEPHLETLDETRQSNQAVLEKASERFALLYEYAPVGYCTVDLSGVVRQSNQAAQALCRRSDEELVGADIAKVLGLLPSFDLPRYLQECHALCHTCSFRACSVTSDPRYKSIKVVATRKPTYPDGEKEIMLALIDQTSEQAAHQNEHFLLQAGEMLSQSSGTAETLRHVLQLAGKLSHAVVILDVWQKGSWAHRYVQDGRAADGTTRESNVVPRLLASQTAQNEAYFHRCRVFQGHGKISRDEVYELFAGLDAAPHLEAEGISGAIVVPLSSRGRMVGVMTFLQSENTHPADANYDANLVRYARMVASYIDNSFLLKLAQDSLNSREHILAVVSHDLRSPLSAIRMRSERLLHGRRASSEPNTVEAAKLIVKYADRMNRLIDAWRDVTPIHAGVLSMTRTKIIVRDFLGDIKEIWTPAFESSGLRLVLGESHDACIYADRDRLLQAAGNLLANALKFTPKEGSLTLTATPKEDTILFAFTDTGIGIEKEKLGSVFTTFWQGHDTDKRGVGLGLSIAKGIVETSGGKIWIDSHLGEGTSVYFTMPLWREQHVRPPIEACSILVVEDDPELAEVVRDIFEDAGHSVSIAANGKQALDFLSVHPLPRLVLLDLRMPVMDGWDFLELKRQMPAFDGLKVVLYSSASGVENRAAALNAGFMPKGAPLKDLMALVG